MLDAPTAAAEAGAACPRRRRGARVIATTGRVDKEQCLRDLGADAVVNYRAVADWHTAVRDITGGRGVDRVVDRGH